MGGPALAGAFQVTLSVVESLPGATVGAAGAAGASVSSSVTVMVMVWSAVSTRSPLPPVARTVTRYSLLPAALAGSLLAASCASSKLGAAVKLRAPVEASRVKRPSSAPPASV